MEQQTRQTPAFAETKPAERRVQGPVVIAHEMLKLVAGGAPKGGWTADPLASTDAPKGGWY